MKAKLMGVVALAAAIGPFSVATGKVTISGVELGESSDEFIARSPGSPGQQQIRAFAAQATAVGFTIYQAALGSDERLSGKIPSEKPLFCMPETLRLTGSQIIDIFRRGVAMNKIIGDMPWQNSLLFVFKDTFPCNKH